jgi:hypothetical protein
MHTIKLDIAALFITKKAMKKCCEDTGCKLVIAEKVGPMMHFEIAADDVMKIYRLGRATSRHLATI